MPNRALLASSASVNGGWPPSATESLVLHGRPARVLFRSYAEFDFPEGSARKHLRTNGLASLANGSRSAFVAVLQQPLANPLLPQCPTGCIHEMQRTRSIPLIAGATYQRRAETVFPQAHRG